MENLPFSDDSVDKVGIAIKLILDDVVEHFEEKKHQVVVGWVGEQEPGSAEGLQKVEQFAGTHHGH